MMIQSAAASDPYARAASLDSAPRSPGATGGDASSGGGASASTPSPDVVVTLGQGTSATDTYNASGRFATDPTLDDMGANAPDSLAKATESSSATSDAASAADPMADDVDVKAGQDAAVPA